MSRELHDHETNTANRQIRVTADERDPNSSASHGYTVELPGQADSCRIVFQNGPVADGINGLTNEALLAILIDRLRGFQAGKYACREKALALTKLEEALHWVGARTRLREARGVEGTHEV